MDEYTAWTETVPAAIKGDSLWHVKAYRLSLFAADSGWHDVGVLSRDSHIRSLADQLFRSIGSISANIAEGYSRGTSRDRALFYRYALGSARESRDWYYKARHLLPEQRLSDRLDLISQIIRLLLTMILEQGGHTINEEYEAYEPE